MTQQFENISEIWIQLVSVQMLTHILCIQMWHLNKSYLRPNSKWWQKEKHGNYLTLTFWSQFTLGKVHQPAQFDLDSKIKYYLKRLAGEQQCCSFLLLWFPSHTSVCTYTFKHKCNCLCNCIWVLITLQRLNKYQKAMQTKSTLQKSPKLFIKSTHCNFVRSLMCMCVTQWRCLESIRISHINERNLKVIEHCSITINNLLVLGRWTHLLQLMVLWTKTHFSQCKTRHRNILIVLLKWGKCTLNIDIENRLYVKNQRVVEAW